jgi:site-specific recombinase XerD
MELIQSMNLQKAWDKNEGEHYIVRFIKSYQSKNTQTVYAKSIYEFFNWMYGDAPITKERLLVTQEDVGEYNLSLLKQLNDGKIKTNTYNNRIKGIKKFYAWLIVETQNIRTGQNFINANPFGNIKQLDTEVDVEGSDFLTEKEIELMLNNPFGEDEHTKERNKLIFVLALSTGTRNSALITITEENLQIIDGKYCICILDKGNKKFKKEIKEEYYNELLTWYHEDLKYRCIKNNSIFNIIPTTASRMIKSWAKSIDIEKRITFHSLRTTSAIEIYKSTNNVYEVKKFMGHSKIETTDIYLGKQNEVNSLGKNIIDNIKHERDFDSVVDIMSEEDAKNLLKSLAPQIKAQLLSQLIK